MPFPTKKVKDPDFIPTNRKTEWGTPSGRVRHIELKGDYALYVLEEEPALCPLSMKRFGTWSHDVWLPWRYYIIKVFSNCRVFGKAPGFMFFSKNRMESIDDKCLKKAIFPNVFNAGGICLGFTGHLWDKTPVRTAWRAVRTLYSKPGNSWFTKEYVPRSLWDSDLKKHEEHLSHRLEESSYSSDLSCYWSALSKEQVMAVEWYSASYSNIREVFSVANWNYNGDSVFTDDQVESFYLRHPHLNRGTS